MQSDCGVRCRQVPTDLSQDVCTAQQELLRDDLQDALYDEDSFLRALALDPQFAETHLGLSNLYIKIQEWGDKALAHLDAFLAEHPNPQNAGHLWNVRSRIQNIIGNEDGRFPTNALDDR